DHTDADLIAHLLGRDRARADAALAEIYRRHSNAVYRFASMIASSSEIAGDAMQEAFIWFAGDGAARFDASRGSIASLLCGVARNHVLRLQSADARFVLTEDDDEFQAIIDADDNLSDSFAELDSREREAAMHEALAQLPHEFREVIVLVEFEEYSYEAAAAIIGCPIGTIRSRLNRAKARLRDSLQELFTYEERNTA
ncbi:MAG: RNA polymerase sigma factor, partial [Casimicrobium sp.]